MKQQLHEGHSNELITWDYILKMKIFEIFSNENFSLKASKSNKSLMKKYKRYESLVKRLKVISVSNYV